MPRSRSKASLNGEGLSGESVHTRHDLSHTGPGSVVGDWSNGAQSAIVGVAHVGNGNGQKMSVAAFDSDHLLSVHRRKMLRRAANRRSAQLSRARKKVSFVFLGKRGGRMLHYARL